MKNYLLAIMFISSVIGAMEQDGSGRQSVPTASQGRTALFQKLSSFLKVAEKNLGLASQSLAFDRQIETMAQTDERGLIVINPTGTDEDILKQQICHELGHVKDGSSNKKLLAMGAYYPSCIMMPMLFVHGIGHLLPFNSAQAGLLYSGATLSGVCASLFFHNTVSRIVNRHLEKRADLIGFEYLLNAKEYKPISRTLIELEQSKLLGIQHDSDHPAPADIYDYLTSFLRNNKIEVQSESQKNNDATLSGTLSLIKDGQTISRVSWQWKPKC